MRLPFLPSFAVAPDTASARVTTSLWPPSSRRPGRPAPSTSLAAQRPASPSSNSILRTDSITPHPAHFILGDATDRDAVVAVFRVPSGAASFAEVGSGAAAHNAPATIAAQAARQDRTTDL